MGAWQSAYVQRRKPGHKLLDLSRFRSAPGAHESFRNVPRYGLLKQVTQQIAIPETAVTVLREGGMIGHPICQIETTEPAIRQV
jgi:protein subunit release factor B